MVAVFDAEEVGEAGETAMTTHYAGLDGLVLAVFSCIQKEAQS